MLVKFLEINIEGAELLNVKSASSSPERKLRLINFGVPCANIVFSLKMEASAWQWLIRHLLCYKFHFVCYELISLSDHGVKRLSLSDSGYVAAS